MTTSRLIIPGAPAKLAIAWILLPRPSISHTLIIMEVMLIALIPTQHRSVIFTVNMAIGYGRANFSVHWILHKKDKPFWKLICALIVVTGIRQIAVERMSSVVCVRGAI